MLKDLLILLNFLFACEVLGSISINEPCSLTNEKLNECLMEKLNDMKKYIKTGIPELDIPVLDPLDVDKFEIDQKLSKTSWVKAKFTNLKSTGASNLQYEEVKFNPNDLSGEIDVFLPSISAETDYDFNGQFFMSVYKNTGFFNGTFTDIKVKASGTFEKVNKRNVDVLQLNKADFSISMGGGKINLVSKEPTKQVIADLAMRLFNENPSRMFETVAPFYIRTVMPSTKLLINNILAMVPYDKLFTD